MGKVWNDKPADPRHGLLQGYDEPGNIAERRKYASVTVIPLIPLVIPLNTSGVGASGHSRSQASGV
jgi:hypothetical protein